MRQHLTIKARRKLHCVLFLATLQDGTTPLHTAVRRGDSRAVAMLLQGGAKVVGVPTKVETIVNCIRFYSFPYILYPFLSF
jgi:ankyrin repeat protein